MALEWPLCCHLVAVGQSSFVLFFLFCFFKFFMVIHYFVLDIRQHVFTLIISAIQLFISGTFVWCIFKNSISLLNLSFRFWTVLVADEVLFLISQNPWCSYWMKFLWTFVSFLLWTLLSSLFSCLLWIFQAFCYLVFVLFFVIPCSALGELGGLRNLLFLCFPILPCEFVIYLLSFPCLGVTGGWGLEKWGSFVVCTEIISRMVPLPE